MIKVNLLESVTDRPQGVAAVEEKVASRGMQTLLLALTAVSVLPPSRKPRRKASRSSAAASPLP